MAWNRAKRPGSLWISLWTKLFERSIHSSYEKLVSWRSKPSSVIASPLSNILYICMNKDLKTHQLHLQLPHAKVLFPESTSRSSIRKWHLVKYFVQQVSEVVHQMTTTKENKFQELRLHLSLSSFSSVNSCWNQGQDARFYHNTGYRLRTILLSGTTTSDPVGLDWI